MVLTENISGAAQVIVEAVLGDLQIRGRSGTELAVEGDGAEIVLDNRDETTIRVQAQGDCDIKLPESTPLRIQQVNGDIDKLTGIQARIDIDSIGGDAMLRRLEGQVTIATINGDLEMKSIDGNVAVTDGHGDAHLQRINGQVTVGNIHGDLMLSEISGSCRVELVRGDLQINIAFAPENTYQFAADGDIEIMVTADTNATFYMPPDIDIDFSGRLEGASRSFVDPETRQNVLELGAGQATVRINDAGSIDFVSDSSMGSFGTEFEFKLDKDLGQLGEQLSGLSDLGEIIERKTRQGLSAAAKVMKDLDVKVEMQAERAQERARRHKERMERAEERIRRAEERAQRRAERFSRFNRHQQQDNWEPVSEEERLLILKMVQDGKISVEEADRLLTTLEGK